MDKPTADDIAQVMVDGGNRLCDHAIEQWIAGKYGCTHEVSREMVQWWRIVKRSIPTKRELTKQLTRDR